MKSALLSAMALLLAVGCVAPEPGGTVTATVAPSRPAVPARSGAGTYFVPATDQPIALDGRLDPEEWQGLSTESCLNLTTTHDLVPAKQPSQVWMMRDRLWLYVGVRSPINPAEPLRKASVWGENDAVELSFQQAGQAKATTYVLRGYPSMRFQSLTLGGAKPKEIERLSQSVSIRAKSSSRDSLWTMEWRISLRAIGIDPANDRQVAFNVTVCKPGSQEMVCWRPSTLETWRLDGKGLLQLAPQPPPRRIMVPGLAPTPD